MRDSDQKLKEKHHDVLPPSVLILAVFSNPSGSRRMREWQTSDLIFFSPSHNNLLKELSKFPFTFPSLTISLIHVSILH